jgi:hypothetical protein
MMVIDDVKTAVDRGDSTAACQALARAGLAFDTAQSTKLRTDFKAPRNVMLFMKCIARSCEWAGFVGDDPQWYADACHFFETGTARWRKYVPGYHGRRADPIANLKTWLRILEYPRVLVEPKEATPASDVIGFYQDAFAALKHAAWRDEKDWLGPWTFHGAFKIYLTHRSDLWNAPGINAITLPTGGKADGGAFEGGWSVLKQLGLAVDPPAAVTFDEKLVRAQALHAEVSRLATLAGSIALHVNSGIYLLGSS